MSKLVRRTRRPQSAEAESLTSALAPDDAGRGRRRLLWLRVRIALLALLLVAAAGAVTRRAYELQIERAPALAEMARAQHYREMSLAPARGSIFDRHGAELAVSVDAESISANPRQMHAEGVDVEAAAMRLSELLGVDRERLVSRFSSRRYFVWVKRHVTPQLAQRVRDLDIPGVQIDFEAKRYYPNRELAAHVLGFANIDGRGIEGLELSLEERLRGSRRSVQALRDRRRRVVYSELLLDDRSAQGDDVFLTLDKTLQRVAERELELAIRTFEARAGSVVVMDPQTGELLALANYPTFNPNEPGQFPPSYRRNRAVTDRFEPGSTIKPFTVAAALMAGTVGPAQTIDCEGGAWRFDDDHTIHDTTPHDLLTPAEILMHSSNIGAAKVGLSLGERGLYRALRRFGFGSRTELPLPGETRGDLRHHSDWHGVDAHTIAFGQGMSTNSIQLAAAMSVLANGGELVRPQLVRRIVDGSGNTVEEMVPEVRRRVVPRRTARLVSDMLTAVTGPSGTAPEAAIDGFLVAGKTGTAQKSAHGVRGYAEDRWVSSFVGYAPADDPQVVIAVVIDEPVVDHIGGRVAGPVFRRVGEVALRHLGVPAASGGEALVAFSREQNRRRRLTRRYERQRARLERQAARRARQAEREAQREARRAARAENGSESMRPRASAMARRRGGRR